MGKVIRNFRKGCQIHFSSMQKCEQATASSAVITIIITGKTKFRNLTVY
jgi:hypothetical protein